MHYKKTDFSRQKTSKGDPESHQSQRGESRWVGPVGISEREWQGFVSRYLVQDFQQDPIITAVAGVLHRHFQIIDS